MKNISGILTVKNKTVLLFSLGFCFACFLSGCSSQQPYVAPSGIGYATLSPVTPMPPFNMPHTLTHEVGPSETLWRIAKIYSVDMQTLMNVNRLSDATRLKTGQKLIIPNTLGPRPVIPLYPSYRWKYIVIHHTATDVGNALLINNAHQERGFWNGLGYHFMLDNGTLGKIDGQIEVGPRWIKQEVGAHTKAGGMNEKGIGIGVVGNYSQSYLTERSLDALVYLVKTLQNYYRIPDSNVIGHRDVPGANTECPGRMFPWAEFKRRLAY